jgi:hypothetical protein
MLPFMLFRSDWLQADPAAPPTKTRAAGEIRGKSSMQQD